MPCVFRDDLFAGRVALVTGGAGGIGRAICILLGRLGASIVTCGRDQAKLDQLAGSLEALRIACQTERMTIRDPEQVAELLAAAHDQQGRVDIVVNNAGGQFPLPAVDVSPKGWAAVVETNLYGTWYVMQAAAREWIARGRPGRSSTSALSPGADPSVYPIPPLPEPEPRIWRRGARSGRGL